MHFLLHLELSEYFFFLRILIWVCSWSCSGILNRNRKALSDFAFDCLFPSGFTPWSVSVIYHTTFIFFKIPNTGDTESLNRCGQQYHCFARGSKTFFLLRVKNIYLRRRKTRKKIYLSYVSCHLFCHPSLMPTAKATDPPPANSPTMHSRLVRKDPKPPPKNHN